ncbi:MAG TPA: hypothetical protein VGF56_04465 [Rhizomicrobium sp.]
MRHCRGWDDAGLSVTTTGADGAACTVSNADGERSLTTPATIKIGRSHSDLTVKCTKPGFYPAVRTFKAARSHYNSQAKDPSFLSLPEAAVDAASGAMWEYPGAVTLDMTLEK